jgi:hypothetical protein
LASNQKQRTPIVVTLDLHAGVSCCDRKDAWTRDGRRISAADVRASSQHPADMAMGERSPEPEKTSFLNRMMDFDAAVGCPRNGDAAFTSLLGFLWMHEVD